MNKQELIDELVDLLDGKLRNHAQLYISGDRIYKYRSEYSAQAFFVCTPDEFNQRARELGWINGYKYGVEYESNGQKPDLPNDVLVDLYIDTNLQYGATGWLNEAKTVGSRAWDGGIIEKFRIVDERYKPVEVEQAQADWYDYDKQQAIALPSVGAECEYISSFFGTKKRYNGTCKVIAYYQDKVWVDVVGYNEFVIHLDVIKFRPLDWNRKADEEKRKFVDAALDIICGKGRMLSRSDTESKLIASELYDSGLFELKNKAAS